MTDEHKQTIQAKVLDEIKSGRVAMRPKWHFALNLALVAVGAAMALALVWYVVSFAIFILHDSGAWFGPTFGPRGWLVVLGALPGVLIFLAIIFVIILEVLVRHFAFSYRRPIVYSLGGIVLLVVVGSAAVAKGRVHERLTSYAERHHMPMMAPLARAFRGRPSAHLFPGTIATTTDTGFILTTRRGDAIYIRLSPGTRMPPGFLFTVGDKIMVFGDRMATSVTAFGIRPLCPPRQLPPPPGCDE